MIWKTILHNIEISCEIYHRKGLVQSPYSFGFLAMFIVVQDFVDHIDDSSPLKDALTNSPSALTITSLLGYLKGQLCFIYRQLPWSWKLLLLLTFIRSCISSCSQFLFFFYSYSSSIVLHFSTLSIFLVIFIKTSAPPNQKQSSSYQNKYAFIFLVRDL